MGLVVLHLHLHGLFRGHDLELGRDPDTGGQTTYVLELARSLAARPELDRVEVLTRLIQDPRVDADYARPLELVEPGLSIRRHRFGPAGYLAKEQLWPHLDRLVEELITSLLAAPRLPDWIHAHYADAGYVGARLQQRLGLPLVFTAHSLGREKRRRLIDAGLDPAQLDALYALERRIAAEELALAHSCLVVTSTRQELERQYADYANFRPERARVIAPGVDAGVFYPPRSGGGEAAMAAVLAPLLQQPALPPLLALCRPDPRKNVPALVEAFGRSASLRRRHNLVLVLGPGLGAAGGDGLQRQVLDQVLARVEHLQLQGRVALPRQLRRHQIPALYRWAAGLGGVFVNPAFTEPFGLTLLEAAASGLPLVATNDGGPREILQRCANGLLVDVADGAALQRALEEALAQPLRWRRWSTSGVEAVRRQFSWDAHGTRYVGEAIASIGRSRRRRRGLRLGAPRPAQGAGVVPLSLG